VSYLAPELVTGGLSLILKGKSGRGKTHLAIAIAIAYRAIQQGFTARFVTAAALIEELSAASRQEAAGGAHGLPASARASRGRSLERGRLMLLDGPSCRTQHLDIDVDGAEFAHDEPEPTDHIPRVMVGTKFVDGELMEAAA
jgi:hypothetical protein